MAAAPAGVPSPALVIGLGAAGAVTARQLRRRGVEVVAVEDTPGDRARAVAADLGLTLLEAPTGAAATALLDEVAVVVPSPAVRPSHPLVAGALARGLPVWSEFELASRWGAPPMVVITGTNGKTTVTTLVTAMAEAAGRRTADAGNNDVPLVDVLDHDLELVVVEASSFRLEFTETFRPRVAVWLNLAEDHLDWHGTMHHYAAAKAKIFAHQTASDVAVVNADDPVVMAATAGIEARVVTFGAGAAADYRVAGGDLLLPDGSLLLAGSELFRSLPHDLTNALAAGAAAIEAGIAPDAVRSALRAFRGLPHRVALVGEAGGVRYYDDSKATDPHAAQTAIRGFDSVVLVAGGRNKGLDLSVLAGEADRIRSVVAIGDAAPEVVQAFAGVRPVVTAASMTEAVRAARVAARPGDAVLLSPGCASYDWYGSYAERGDDFARAVAAETGAGS